MIRTLLIIAGAAFVLSLVTLSGAAAIGGRDMAANGWAWTFKDDDGSDIRIVRADDARAADVTRTLAWDGAESLVIDLAADVEYVQGETAGIQVIGPANLVDQVAVEGDRLFWKGDGERSERIVYGRNQNGRGFWINGDHVRVVVTAPAVTRFELRSSADVAIRDYDQPSLTLVASGSGDLTVSGAAKSVAVTVTGSGDVDLSDLLAEDADVNASGSGDVRIAPSGAAKLALSGSGDVDLSTRPTSLTQTITGSGDVNQN